MSHCCVIRRINLLVESIDSQNATTRCRGYTSNVTSHLQARSIIVN